MYPEFIHGDPTIVRIMQYLPAKNSNNSTNFPPQSWGPRNRCTSFSRCGKPPWWHSSTLPLFAPCAVPVPCSYWLRPYLPPRRPCVWPRGCVMEGGVGWCFRCRVVVVLLRLVVVTLLMRVLLVLLALSAVVVAVMVSAEEGGGGHAGVEDCSYAHPVVILPETNKVAAAAVALEITMERGIWVASNARRQLPLLLLLPPRLPSPSCWA